MRYINRNCQIGVLAQAPGGGTSPMFHSWWRQWLHFTKYDGSTK